MQHKHVPTDHYMNRLEWMGHRFKDNNSDAYDWEPEVFATVEPSPRYQNPAAGEKTGMRQYMAR